MFLKNKIFQMLSRIATVLKSSKLPVFWNKRLFSSTVSHTETINDEPIPGQEQRLPKYRVTHVNYDTLIKKPKVNISLLAKKVNKIVWRKHDFQQSRYSKKISIQIYNSIPSKVNQIFTMHCKYGFLCIQIQEMVHLLANVMNKYIISLYIWWWLRIY